MCWYIFSNPLAQGYSAGMDLPKFESHSAVPIDMNLSTGTSETTNTALKFAEGLPGASVSYTPSRDETFELLHNEEIGLHDLLSRPQKIAAVDWQIGTSLTIPGGEISILAALLKTKRVVNRINNFRYLNATVHVRVVVSGVPQHYGMGMVAMNPWYNTDYTNFEKGGNTGPTFNQQVQLPHVFIDPSTSTGGDLSMPLILPTNALHLYDEESVNNAVALSVMSFTTLQTVSNTDTPVAIAIWAWLSDVVLTNPTSENLPYLQAQSSDEYGKPTVSKTASTLAKWSDYFSTVPIIGSYARASSMVLDTTAKIAELFGYSRPTSNKVEMRLQNTPLGNLTHYNFEDSCVKLTMDAKNEVTIDPRISGVNLGDEMAISTIVAREGYLGAMTWKMSDASNKAIGRMCVTPTLTRQVVTTGILPHINGVYDFSPVSFVAHAFRQWRGTLKFRFVAVCSAFHKGRIRFVFEPGDLMDVVGAWNTETNVNQSYILDLSRSKEMTIEIPWATWKSYLSVRAPPTVEPNTLFDFTTDQTLTVHSNRDDFNGLLGAHVLVPLTSPAADSEIRILVFVSGGKDMEFQEPGNAFANYRFAGFEPQSGAENDLGAQVLTGNELVTVGQGDNHDICGTHGKSLTDKLAEIHYGERIVSIRQLMKRYVHHSVNKLPSMTGFASHTLTFSDFPSYKGYTTEARFNTATGEKFNYARDSYLAYFTLAYLGYRGSIRQKYFLEPINGNNYLIGVSRSTQNNDANTFGTLATSVSQIGNSINNSEFDTRLGAVVGTAALNNVVEVETPYYSPYRFMFAKWTDKFDDVLKDFGLNFTRHTFWYRGFNQSQTTYVTRYVAAGDDFQLIFFKYAPCGYAFGNPPPSTSD